MCDLDKPYWMISYFCAGTTNGGSAVVAGAYGIDATSMQPADWCIDASKRFSDGPYIILYAERITSEQHKEIKDHLA